MMRPDLPPEMSRMLRPDGSVVIPASIAGDVLRRLLRDLAGEVSANGGRLSPAVYRVMWALHGAAEEERERTSAGSADGTPVGTRASVEISTTEAARRMGCSESYVRRLARLGLVPARRVAGVWLIARAAGAADDETEAA
ncbi:helix-turn-helix domain-containing protein [Streptomyces phaeoluteigriseus]|uniref:helix-turn-helix domain-containing protein n=1 Tax=Streptomyces phaeoluteigriseus TaxID=114686 RepID=UPI00368686BD